MTHAATETRFSGSTTEGSATGDEPQNPQQFFAENGYLILRGVVSKEKLSHLSRMVLEEFERLKQSGSLFTGGGSLAGHLNCTPGEKSRLAYEELQSRGIVDLLTALSPKAAAG